MKEKSNNLRVAVFRVIQPDSTGYWPSLLFDWTITTLILLSVASVFIVTLDLTADVRDSLRGFEAAVSVVFTLEYALRIWTAPELYSDRSPWRARASYVVSGMALIDLLAILPFWVPMFLPGSMLGMRAFRLVRLLRIFKLNRYFDALTMVGCVVRDKRRELVGSIFFVAILMLVSSLLVYAVEHDAQELLEGRHWCQVLKVLFFKNELARIHRFILPTVKGRGLRFWEDDFHDFEVHEVEDGPDVPTFRYYLIRFVFGRSLDLFVPA
jgi:voltage-gated potassium channel